MDTPSTLMYVVRHGDVMREASVDIPTFYGPEAPLSRDGERQMRSLARKIGAEHETLDAIYTSPTARTQQSAKILAGALGVSSITVTEGLNDVWAPGFVGLPMETIRYAYHGDIYRYPLTDDQETYQEVCRRISQEYRAIALREQGRRVAIVTHLDPILGLLYMLKHSKLDDVPLQEVQLPRGTNINRGEACKLVINEAGYIKEMTYIGKEGGKRAIEML